MQINDQAYDSLNRKSATFLLVLATLLMFLAEATIIPGLWFRPLSHDYGFKRYSLPFLIFCPMLLPFAFRIGQKKWVASGSMSSTASAAVSAGFGAFLMLVYTCILELAELAF